MLPDWVLLLPNSRNTFSSEHVEVLKKKKRKKKEVF